MWEWILIIAILYGGYKILHYKYSTPPKGTRTPDLNREEITKNIADIIRGNGTFSLNVVGESHYQHALNRICGGKTDDGHNKNVSARLLPEPDNPYDSNAVAVYIDDDIVGYLDKQTAKRYKGILHESVIEKCPAIITGGWTRKNNSEGHYGVKLDLNI